MPFLYVQKMHIALFLKLSFFKNIIYLTGNHCSISLEQIRHLLCQPHSLILQPYFKLYG